MKKIKVPVCITCGKPLFGVKKEDRCWCEKCVSTVMKEIKLPIDNGEVTVKKAPSGSLGVYVLNFINNPEKKNEDIYFEMSLRQMEMFELAMHEVMQLYRK